MKKPVRVDRIGFLFYRKFLLITYETKLLRELIESVFTFFYKNCNKFCKFVIFDKKMVDFVLKSGKIVVYVQGEKVLSCIQGGNYG